MPVADNVEEIITQLTQRKLQYCRDLLKAAELPYTGDRERIRRRVRDGLSSGKLFADQLAGLLEELDAWGDQRVLVRQFAIQNLASFASEEALMNALQSCGLQSCFGGTVPTTPAESLVPVAVRFVQEADNRKLVLVAAKTRLIWQLQDDVPELTNEAEYPGVVFRPFKRETQKVIAFAEIDLNSGMTLISSAIMRRGTIYTAEYEEFYDAFSPLLDLRSTDGVALYAATTQLRQLPQNEVRQVSQNRRTAIGGTVGYRSHSSRADIRTDAELQTASGAVPNLPCEHFNGFWHVREELQEPVHTHVYAPKGEITILGQVREEGARYVLHRILSLN